MNYPGSLPQNENINAVMLNQQPGSPDAYQLQQSMQQAAKKAEVDAGTNQAQNIAAISGAARAASAGQDTPENQARALMLNYATGIQSITPGGGQAKMALAQDDAREVMRRIYG
jgi:microcystin-dependent protein